MLRKEILCLVLSAALLIPMGSTVQAAEKYVNPGDLLVNGDFHDGVAAPWELRTNIADADYEVEKDACKVTVNDRKLGRSKDLRYCVELLCKNLTLQAGHTYNVSFTVTADHDCKIYPSIGDTGDPYNEYWNGEGNLNNGGKTWEPVQLQAGETKTVHGSFRMDEDVSNCKFYFMMAGDCAPDSWEKESYSYTISNVSVKDDQYPGTKVKYEDTEYGIRTNQLGYYADSEKKAEAVLADSEPVGWKLVNSENKVVKEGKTSVYGKDNASGDFIHKIDFSDFYTIGKGYKLILDSKNTAVKHNNLVDADVTVLNESNKFDIKRNVYADLEHKAAKYFYFNRNGIKLEKQYTDGREDLSQPMVYPYSILRCSKTNADYKTPTWYNEDYSLDVGGGWYDSDNYDKNVSKAGISVWTLQNIFEHALNITGDTSSQLCTDGSLNIPESGDGIPDILNEARFELEFMLKMQVPDEYKYAGMVHQKIAKELGFLSVTPPEEYYGRQLMPPTTAATLNLAASAAQGARLWKDYDADFSEKALNAAKKAYEAAKKHPDIYADESTDTKDHNLSDEFYWAACELYASTGDETYLNDMKANENYLSMPTVLDASGENSISGCFDFKNVEGLGTLSLLASKNNISAEDKAKAKENVIKAADVFVDNQKTDGYGNTIKMSKLSNGNEGYQKDSNGYAANTAILLGYASDINSSSGKYINAADSVMDYLLGNNPNAKSYVTGFGIDAVKNPHNFLWKNVYHKELPTAPDGVLVSGPTSEESDSILKSYNYTAKSTPAAKLYYDDSEETAANNTSSALNAPLVWAASYLDVNNPVIDHGFPGDVNGDGVVDISDYTLLRKYINAGKDGKVKIHGGDINSDGKIDILDLIALRKLI